MKLTNSVSIRGFFEEEARQGRRLLPNPRTVGGWGTCRKYEWAASLMAHPSVTRVVDIGCNRGSIEYLFHRLYPERSKATFISGFDVCTSAITQARELGLPNCQFDTYDGRALPVDSESADVALLVEVIEHAVNKEEVLREAVRVLRPGGTLFLTTPNPSCLALKLETVLWTVLRVIFRKRAVQKDLFIHYDKLAKLLDGVGLQATSARLYFWPRLFVQFCEWSLLPPLPPSALFVYQHLCVDKLDHAELPGWLAKPVYWTLGGVLRKPVAPEDDSEDEAVRHLV